MFLKYKNNCPLFFLCVLCGLRSSERAQLLNLRCECEHRFFTELLPHDL